jgi:hypothetical protein
VPMLHSCSPVVIQSGLRPAAGSRLQQADRENCSGSSRSMPRSVRTSIQFTRRHALSDRHPRAACSRTVRTAVSIAPATV